jgi:hypothetical protein
VSGDGYDDFSVGAYGNDSAGSLAGSITLFAGPVVNGTFSVSDGHEIAGPYASGDSYFGYQQPSRQRDLSGDGQVDVVGGAFYDDSTAYDAGGVYIFGGLL